MERSLEISKKWIVLSFPRFTDKGNKPSTRNSRELFFFITNYYFSNIKLFPFFLILQDTSFKQKKSLIKFQNSFIQEILNPECKIRFYFEGGYLKIYTNKIRKVQENPKRFNVINFLFLARYFSSVLLYSLLLKNHIKLTFYLHILRFNISLSIFFLSLIFIETFNTCIVLNN